MAAQIINFQDYKEAKDKEDVTKDFLAYLLGEAPSREAIQDLIKAVEKENQPFHAKEEVPAELEFKFVGEKYDRDMDVKDIAKLVRADIKKAIKEGTLPKGVKFSVRIDRYSMGQSLNAYMTAWPGEVLVKVEDELRYTKELEEALKVVRSIIKVYNFDDSDSMSDYFHVNFYSEVSVDYKLREENYERLTK